MVFPNPAIHHFTLRIENESSGPVLIRVFDTVGKEVLKFTEIKKAQKMEKQIEMSQLPKGMYYIQVSADHDQQVVRRVIKQ